MPILCAKPQTDIAKAKNQGGYKHVMCNLSETTVLT